MKKHEHQGRGPAVWLFKNVQNTVTINLLALRVNSQQQISSLLKCQCKVSLGEQLVAEAALREKHVPNVSTEIERGIAR